MPTPLLSLALLSGLSAAAEPAVGPGRYGLELVLGSDSDLPFLGQTPGTSRSWSLVDVREVNGQRVQRLQTCAVRMEGRTGTTSVHLPAAFVASLPQREVPLLQDSLYRVDLGEDAIGYDPKRGPMPTALGDPALLDSDRDGHPGATVELHIPVLGVVQLYIVQRGHVRLQGRQSREGVISGTVETVALDQRTLGASRGMFEHSPVVTPRPERSSFRLVPLPKVKGCAEVRPAFCARGDSEGACADGVQPLR